MKLGLVFALLLGVALATSSPAGAALTPSACTFTCEDCVRACRSSDCRTTCTAIASGCCIAAGKRPPTAPGFCGCH